MSAGHDGVPHAVEPDCGDVLDAVYAYVDGEVDQADVEAIRTHLHECAPCLRQYDLEVALKALVRRSCQDRAPEHLRRRILAQITEIRATSIQAPEARSDDVQVTEVRVTEVQVTEVRVTTEG